MDSSLYRWINRLADRTGGAHAAAAALGIGRLVGSAVDRARPYETMTNVQILVDRTTDFSFPSDHTTVAGAVAVGFLFANRRWGVVASVLAVLMAFTRVYVGAPYQCDVIAGLALGASPPRPGGSRSCRSSAGWPDG